jgi:hypothetical protein
MSFETMPKMEMDIEPIVSSKQITYSLILRTIESKIREVVAESIVLPFWDDVPFQDTLGQAFRGGIWQRDAPESNDQVEIPDESGETPATPKSVGGDPIEVLKSKDDRTMSMPALSESATSKKKTGKSPKSSLSDLKTNSSSAISTGIERPESTPLPRAIRSQTFSNAAHPVVTADNAKVDKVVTGNKGDEKSHATSAMIEISSRSPPTSPNRTPSSSPPTGGITVPEIAVHSRESSIAESIDSATLGNDNGIQRPSATRMESNSFSSMRSSRGSSTTSLTSDKARRRSTIETITKSFTSSTSSDEKPSGSMTIGSATAAAKKWSWSVFGKGDPNMGQESSQAPAGTLDQPIGRGHPHPPPGTPLPRPDKYALKRNATNLPKRKPVGAHTESERPKTGDSQAPPSPLPRRKPMRPGVHTNESTDELLVVEAPQDSEPNSPAPGDLDSDHSLKKSTPVDSETSSKAEKSGLNHEEKEDASEEAPDAEPIGSVDHTPSTLGSNEALISERVEVPAL